ncbi:Thiopurine S-methyltransferase [Vulgatibacter incomptus]|uniref:thiopurine S-methyltransferase n=1 Tax=Vulgatibacter incomptus TaxID=1391653 RepID=A0A0K1PH69_9BACT|nr:Thiopurine S-methyltransferase [Vulgatibacter incomptus]
MGMDAEFWLSRWREGRIGFHEGRPNDLLVSHARALGPPGRVLVPLSGKTEDMAYLRSLGHEVVGIELAEAAAEEFFREHGLEAAPSPRGALVERSAGGITILQGDFFDARPEDVGAITAFYDRAAIVALPPELRPRYAAHLRELAGEDAPGLVICFEYPQERMAGPPFSVGEDELRRYFPAVERLEDRRTEGPQSRASGIDMRERLYLVGGHRAEPI